MINLLVSNGKALVWDIQGHSITPQAIPARFLTLLHFISVVQALRVQHHICGVLSGTLPQVGQQNIFLGLPLVLMPEEVVLLLENSTFLSSLPSICAGLTLSLGVEIAVIVDDPTAHHQPTTEETRTFEANRQLDIRTQQIEIATFEQAKRSQMELLYKDVIGKRKNEKQKAKAKATPVESITPSEIFDASPESVPTPTPTTTEPIVSTSTGPPVFSEDKLSAISYTITIQPSSTQLPWYRPSESAVIYSTIDEAKQAGIWNYPSTDLESSRCKLFEDLWRRGFFMGGGLKFGGDFLIYPGQSSFSLHQKRLAEHRRFDRRSTSISFPLHSHSPHQPQHTNHAARHRSLRTTSHSSQESSPTWKLERKRIESGLFQFGMGCFWLIGSLVGQMRMYCILQQTRY